MPTRDVEKTPPELEKAEEALLSAQRETQRSLDVTTMLMIAATVLMAIGSSFSAWTSWRVVQLTADFDATYNRPYLGVASIKLDASDPARPKSWIEFRNFGNLPAEQTAIGVSNRIDGHPVSDALTGLQKVVLSLGVLSPASPYNFGALFPPQYLNAIRSGSSRLVLAVDATYTDADGHLRCYQMQYAYIASLDKYDPDGGGSDCKDGMPRYNPETTWEKVVGAGKN